MFSRLLTSTGCVHTECGQLLFLSQLFKHILTNTILDLSLRNSCQYIFNRMLAFENCNEAMFGPRDKTLFQDMLLFRHRDDHTDYNY